MLLLLDLWNAARYAVCVSHLAVTTGLALDLQNVQREVPQILVFIVRCGGVPRVHLRLLTCARRHDLTSNGCLPHPHTQEVG